MSDYSFTTLSQRERDLGDISLTTQPLSLWERAEKEKTQ